MHQRRKWWTECSQCIEIIISELVVCLDGRQTVCTEVVWSFRQKLTCKSNGLLKIYAIFDNKADWTESIWKIAIKLYVVLGVS